MDNNMPSDQEPVARSDASNKSNGSAPEGTRNGSSKLILVPLDGSPLAETALPHAIALARATSSGLLLARLVPPISVIEPMGGLLDGSSALWELYDEQPKLAKQYLKEVFDKLRRYELKISTWITEGMPAEAIPEYAREHPEVVAIAMSTHGRSGLGRWLFGSVAERILHGSPVPLLLLRPEAEPQQVDLENVVVPDYKTILVPLDGSQLAEQAFDFALELARATKGRLYLISVTPTPFDRKLVKSVAPDSEWSAAPWATSADYLSNYLNGITERLREEGVPGEGCVTYGDPAHEILNASKYEKADIIVMATHGRSGLEHLLVGSVAGRVAQAATIPLFLVRVGKQSSGVQHTEPTEARS